MLAFPKPVKTRFRQTASRGRLPITGSVTSTLEVVEQVCNRLIVLAKGSIGSCDPIAGRTGGICVGVSCIDAD